MNATNRERKLKILGNLCGWVVPSIGHRVNGDFDDEFDNYVDNATQRDGGFWGSDEVRMFYIPLLRDSLLRMIPVDPLSPSDCGRKVDTAHGCGNPCKRKCDHLGHCTEDRDPNGDYGSTFEPMECFAEAQDTDNWNRNRYQDTMDWFRKKWKPLLEDQADFNNAIILLDCFIAPWETPVAPPAKKAKTGKKGPGGSPPDQEDPGDGSGNAASSSRDGGYPGDAPPPDAPPQGEKRGRSTEPRPYGRKSLKERRVSSSRSAALRHCDCRVPLFLALTSCAPVAVEAMEWF